MQQVAKLVQIKGRSGFYLRIPVPSDCRKALGTNGIQRKAGSTQQEAIKNRPALLAEAEQLFKKTRGEDPISDAFSDPVVTEGEERIDDVLIQRLRLRGFSDIEAQQIVYGDDALRQQGIDVPAPTPGTTRLEMNARAHLKGGTPYTTWLSKRIIEERPAKNTERAWERILRTCADWYGSEYIGSMTQADAANYKRHCQERVKDASTRAFLQCLKAFWNWTITQGEIKENIWLGLTKKLKHSEAKPPIDAILLAASKDLAIKENNIAYFIQYYTGCRRNEHQGLRWCDVDLVAGLIHFKEYENEQFIRHLKGRKKDERSVPIHTQLKAHLLKMLPEAKRNNSEDPIWPDSYLPKEQSFAVQWGKRFKKSYGFTSHELRALVVSQLMIKNVSPFILYEITLHKVPGMSEVVQGYVRPTIEQVREVIERIE